MNGVYNNSLKRNIQKYSINSKSQEELLYDKIAIIVDSFVDAHKINKKDFLKKVFDAAFELIPEAQKGSFYELNGDLYVPIFVNGYDFELIQNLTFTRSEAFIDFKCSDSDGVDAYENHISKREEGKFSDEILNIFKKLGTYENFTSLYAPIQVDGVNRGIICLDSFGEGRFSKISKKILKFYAQLISNFYSHKIHQENAAQMNEDVVRALVSTIEVKDVYTEGHGQRVMEYSIALAKKLELTERQIQDIGTASLLHDVGKIGVPSSILNKPDKLTATEYEIIKNHPEYSKKILEKIRGFSTIVDYAYNHHERYDGLGYPRGLKCDEIPFASHIIQLADSFDAMTSERSYRKALPKQEALKILEKESGKQFHPAVVKAALSIFPK